MSNSYFPTNILSISLFAIYVAATSPAPITSGRELPKRLLRDKNNPAIFESQDKFSTADIIFNSDSTFTYYCLYKGGYDLTRGYYSKQKGSFIFTWSQEMTNKACGDPAIYNRYFPFARPKKIAFHGEKYTLKGDTLVHTVL
jgi:hypothetical protein